MSSLRAVSAGPLAATPFAELTPPAPAHAPQTMDFPTLFARVSRLQSGSLTASMDFHAARLCVAGRYGQARISMPRTHCDVRVSMSQQQNSSGVDTGSVWFSHPVTIYDPINAFSPPQRGLSGIAQRCLSHVTQYRFHGMTFGSQCQTTLYGESRVLGIFPAPWLDRAIAQAIHRPSSGQSLVPAVRALTSLGQAAVAPGRFEVVGHGTLPYRVNVDFSPDKFVQIPGGSFGLHLTGALDMSAPTGVHVVVQPPPPGDATVLSSFIGMNARADAQLRLDDWQDNKLHVACDGQMEIQVNHLAADLRPKDSPILGGLRFSGGDARYHTRTFAPALTAPVQFRYGRNGLELRGVAGVNMGAVFVDPQQMAPDYYDGRRAFDVRGILSLYASSAVTQGGRPLHRQANYDVGGIVSMEPPGADPVYYKLRLTPDTTDFELQPDYTPAEGEPAALVAAGGDGPSLPPDSLNLE